MDPSLFFDDDGKVYYTRHGGVYQAELDTATGVLKEDPRLVWSGTERNGWHLARRASPLQKQRLILPSHIRVRRFLRTQFDDGPLAITLGAI